MKIQSEVKYTLIVIAFGIAILSSSLLMVRVSKRPASQLAETRAFETLLNKVVISTKDVNLSSESVQELKMQVDEINNAANALSGRDFYIAAHGALLKLTKEAKQIEIDFAQFETQFVNAPDSLRGEKKSEYAAMIASSKEIVIENAKEVELLLTEYQNLLGDRVENASLYQSLYLLLIGALLASLGVLIFKKLRDVRKYEYSVEDKSEKELRRMETLKHFVEAIAEGRYSENVEFEKGDDVAERMVEMKNKLLQSVEMDRKRNWATQGMAEIGTLLRDSSTAEKLYANITKFCVKYTNSNQASLFVLNEEGKDTYLELVSTYAYDKRKFLQKKIDLGEGLVGQAVLEAQTINMTKLPPNYIHITSGLGDSAPNALIVVPLKLNEKVFGVIEMASFHHYEPFEIEFLEKLGESVASSISSARINDQTKVLLEKSQQQMEELRAQEEEVRQNMEELSATQEQMARQMEETKKLADNLQIRENVFALTTILSEADLFGTITVVNSKLLEVSKYTREELIGKPHSIFRHPDMPKELFKLFWDTIKQGKVFRGIIKNRAKDGTHYWVDATIVPVQDESGKTVKYIGARYHITDDTFAEYLYNQQATRLNLPPLTQHQRAA